MWETNGYLVEYVISPHTGIKKKVSVKIKGETKRAEQEAITRLKDKIERIHDTKILMSECVRLWLNECERSVKPSTYRKYRITLASVQKVLGEAYMDKLTAGYVRQRFLDSGESNRTLNGYLKSFKTFWRWAYRNDFVKTSEVADKLQAFQDTPKRERIQDKYLEPKELARLLDEMKEKRWYLVTEFLALSGLRIGELSALAKMDVLGKNIRVSKTYDANNNVTTSAKTFASKREVYIQEELRNCIVRINEYCAWQAEVCGYKSELFFPDTDGTNLKYYAYRKYLAENSEKVLGRKIVPHALRHTHCSMLAAKGLSLEAISDRLGHEDSEITKRIYMHKLEELKEKEHQMLDKMHLIG